MLYYVNADKTKLVPEGDPEAKWQVNSESPGEFAGLLKAQQEAAEEAEKAEASEKAKADAPKAEAKPAARR